MLNSFSTENTGMGRMADMEDSQAKLRSAVRPARWAAWDLDLPDGGCLGMGSGGHLLGMGRARVEEPFLRVLQHHHGNVPHGSVNLVSVCCFCSSEQSQDLGTCLTSWDLRSG